MKNEDVLFEIRCFNKTELNHIESIFNAVQSVLDDIIYPCVFKYSFNKTTQKYETLVYLPCDDNDQKIINYEVFIVNYCETPCDAASIVATALHISEEKEILINDSFDVITKIDSKTGETCISIKKKLPIAEVCIFWDDDKSKAVISTLGDSSEIIVDLNYPFLSNVTDTEGLRLCYKNAIKCESLEQYINFIK